jgi:hypothetical protein
MIAFAMIASSNVDDLYKAIDVSFSRIHSVEYLFFDIHSSEFDCFPSVIPAQFELPLPHVLMIHTVI